MEVAGRKESSDPALLCHPCQGDGDTVHAEGYCENCNELMCSSCIKAHKKMSVTKNHVIKSKNEMPKLLPALSKPCTQLCDVHKNEIVKFYCKEHGSVGCGDCMVLEHTSCKVQLISEVSCNYDDSDELTVIKHRIKLLRKNLDSCKREIERSLHAADDIKTRTIKEIHHFRKEMDAFLDKITKDLIKEVEKMSTDNVSRQQKLECQCKETIENIENIQSQIEQMTDNVNDLFVLSKLVQKKLKICQEVNEELSSKSQINTVKFRPNEDLNTLKINQVSLGILDTQVKKFSGQCEKSIIDKKAHFVQKYNMKGKQERECFITGMTVISETEILCADMNNNSLKLFNYKEGKITSTLKTSGSPFDVTTINFSSAAVTVPYECKILFLNTQNGLAISKSIVVRENCRGIDHQNGLMAVTFVEPPAVQLIDMEGHIVHEVRDTSMLQLPFYVSLSNNRECMLVSDRGSHVVYEFSLTGHLINTKRNQEMQLPASITVTTCGDAVVCYMHVSDEVGVIVPETREILPLLVGNVQHPHSIIICKEHKKMFISEYYQSKDGNYIKIFDLI